MSTNTDTAEAQAKAKLESIIAMIERLEHAHGCDATTGCKFTAREIHDKLDNYSLTLHEAIAEYHDEDTAQEAIHEHTLSVLVRSGWHPVDLKAQHRSTEYEILLCTGGPAVRIRGDLDNYGQPSTARLEYQDWGTPWTYYMSDGAPALLTYAKQFYFGD